MQIKTRPMLTMTPSLLMAGKRPFLKWTTSGKPSTTHSTESSTYVSFLWFFIHRVSLLMTLWHCLYWYLVTSSVLTKHCGTRHAEHSTSCSSIWPMFYVPCRLLALTTRRRLKCWRSISRATWRIKSKDGTTNSWWCPVTDNIPSMNDWMGTSTSICSLATFDLHVEVYIVSHMNPWLSQQRVMNLFDLRCYEAPHTQVERRVFSWWS